jgi:hypothetical protein
MMRVFKQNNDYEIEDLDAWEEIIKQVKEYGKKVKKEKG